MGFCRFQPLGAIVFSSVKGATEEHFPGGRGVVYPEKPPALGPAGKALLLSILPMFLLLTLGPVCIRHGLNLVSAVWGQNQIEEERVYFILELMVHH